MRRTSSLSRLRQLASRVKLIGRAKLGGALHQLRVRGKHARSRLQMRHVHGPRRISMHETDVMIVCLVKDGEEFMTRFVEHHLGLGVKHIVFIDNGSTDETIPIAKRYPQVSVFSSLLPVRDYECILRSQIVESVGRGHWCLVIDIDEFFDYPHSSTVSLRELVGYLERHRFNAVVGQMLDMFPERLPHSVGEEAGDFVSRHRFYDIASVRKYDYHDPEGIEFAYFLSQNRAPDAVKVHFGGIRAALFGTNNCITKHPLIRVRDGLVPVTHPHCSSRAVCADFTVLLKHYKFAGGFAESVRRQVQSGVWAHGENEAYLKVLDERGQIDFKQPTSEEYRDVETLVRNGFLVTSTRFDEWAAR